MQRNTIIFVCQWNNHLTNIHYMYFRWCNPCKMLTPRIETIIGENKGKITLAKVDIDEHSELALDYEVASVPVLLAIRNGKVEQRLVGLQDTDKLRAWVENVVNKK